MFWWGGEKVSYVIASRDVVDVLIIISISSYIILKLINVYSVVKK